MNIVQLHERVRFWVDVVSSTRFESTDIDNALNVAISNKVRESYDQNMPMNKSDSFQRVQRISDELGPIVKPATKSSGITISKENSKNVLSLTVADYGWLLSIKIKDKDLNKEWHNVYPLSFDSKNIIQKNPYRRTRVSPDSKCYFYESNSKFILEDVLGDLEDAEIYYLANPALVSYGIEYDSTKSFIINSNLIAVTEVLYNSHTYNIGESIVIQAPHVTISSGIVVDSYINCDIRQTTHEEVSRRAAINLLLTAGEFEKVKMLREEILAL